MERRVYLALVLSTAMAGCPGESSPEACSADADCPAGRYCRMLTGECAFDCTSNANCPEDFICTNRGRCERGCRPSNGGVEACDGLDNDCDGLTDNLDPRACQRENEFGICAGTELCQEGAWNCDADPPAAEDCDGVDNDCDGETDEGLASNDCPLQAGVCAGALTFCLGSAGWSDCDYGPGYEPGEESSCDRLDNDCDGETDDVLAPLPDCELDGWASDGIDNNCNGVADEPGGCMVEIDWYPGTYIDAYESTVFDNADCTGARYGENGYDYPPGWPTGAQGATVTLYACSLPGLRPSRLVSWYQARRACAAQGKRLCTKAEWAMACTENTSREFPYGENYLPAVCNTFTAGHDDTVPTGSMTGCVTGHGVYDMSGNLWEWASDPCEWDPDGRRDVQGGAYLCAFEDGGIWFDCDYDNPDHADEILWRHNCQMPMRGWYCNPTGTVSLDLGFRCCYDAP